MIRIALFITVLFLSERSYAQNTVSKDTSKVYFITPFDPKGNYQTYAIKGAILPFTIGNGAGVSSVVGVEYGFLKRHSIGIDGNYIYSYDTDDETKDTAGITHKEGNKSTSKEKGIFLSYRYYFLFRKLRERGVSTYASCYVRYGEAINRNNPLYHNPYIYEKQYTRAIGAVGGVVMQFGHPKRLSLDINSGYFVKWFDSNELYYDNGNIKNRNNRYSNLGFRFGLYVHYFFLRGINK
jgi:hypothetical protein